MKTETITFTGDETAAILTLSRPHCPDIEGKHELLEAVNSMAARKGLRAPGELLGRAQELAARIAKSAGNPSRP